MKIYYKDLALVAEGYQPKSMTNHIEAESIEWVIVEDGTARLRTQEEYDAYMKQLTPTLRDEAEAVLDKFEDKLQAITDKIAEIEAKDELQLEADKVLLRIGSKEAILAKLNEKKQELENG